MKRNKMELQIGAFDIEQCPFSEYMWQPYSGFKVDKSFMLSASIMDVTNSISTTFSLSNEKLKEQANINVFTHPNKDDRVAAKQQVDKELVEEVLQEMQKYDIILTWYGARHDIKYINGKAAMHGFPFYIGPRHIDMYDIAKHKLSLSSNRLGEVAKKLGVTNKGDIDPSVWDLARKGDTRALKLIAEYNAIDSIALAEVYEKLKGLVNNHPHVKILENLHDKKNGLIKLCRFCGSKNTIRRGNYFTKSKATERRSCNDCFRWYVW